MSSGRTRRPVRLVHLGLGAFHRAHQAFYTDLATDAHEWGISAFSGQSTGTAHALTRQDGLYTLIERGPSGDEARVVSSIVEAHPGGRVDLLVDRVARPEVVVVTLTVTESGYRLGPDAGPDVSDADVAADLVRVRSALGSGSGPEAVHASEINSVTTPMARLLLGLAARRQAGAGALTIVPCDNLPSNGPTTRAVLDALATEVDTSLAQWIAEHVRVVGTSVDRITPRAAPDSPPILSTTGMPDEAAVVTEPFRDWTMTDDFAAGRPDWASAGARFVSDVEPWERRKLWLLNGAHSILAWTGLVRGHRTVAEAMTDPACRRLVDAFWEEAGSALPPGLDVGAYQRELTERFTNPRIEHLLTQIAIDSATKVGQRILPVRDAALRAGHPASASAAALVAWMEWTRHTETLDDPGADRLRAARNAPRPGPALLAVAAPQRVADPQLVDALSAAGLS